MKKLLLFIGILGLILISFAVADSPTLNVGDSSDSETTIDSGSLNYTEVRTKTISSFEPIYYTFYYDIVTCALAGTNTTIDADKNKYSVVNISGTFNCINVTTYTYLENTTTKGTPIYLYSEINKIEYNEQEFNFDTKGCWVCGEYIACLSKSDGFAYNRGAEFKCDGHNYPIIRSGESGYIQNLKTQQIVSYRTDVGNI